jgi:hypothetical protein
MRWHGRTTMIAGLAASALVLGLMTSAAPAPEKTIDPLEKMQVWEGHWRVQVQYKETAYSHAGSVTYNATCSWLPNRGYMVCDYLSDGVDPQHGKVSNDLSIFTYSEIDKAYKHVGFGMEGEPHEQLTTIVGNVWTTPFEVTAKNGEKLQCRNVYEFDSPEKQHSRFEVSTDGQHWTVLSEAVGTKIQ